MRQNCVIHQADDFHRGTIYSKVALTHLNSSPYLEVEPSARKGDCSTAKSEAIGRQSDWQISLSVNEEAG